MSGYLVEIEKADAMELSKHIEEGLRHMGRAMSIVEELCGGEYGERNYYPRMGYRNEGGNMGYRGGYGGNMGYRDETDMPKYDEYGNPMGMRGRMRDSRGRYM